MCSNSSVVSSEKIVAELRILQFKMNDLKKYLTQEIKNLRHIVEKQNQNSLNLENLRNLIGHSRSAVITFVKPGEKYKVIRPALYVKNRRIENNFKRYKYNTLASKNSLCLSENNKKNYNATKIRRTLSESQKYTFDFVKNDRTKVSHSTLLLCRVENIFRAEILRVACYIEKLKMELRPKFYKCKYL